MSPQAKEILTSFGISAAAAMDYMIEHMEEEDFLEVCQGISALMASAFFCACMAEEAGLNQHEIGIIQDKVSDGIPEAMRKLFLSALKSMDPELN